MTVADDDRPLARHRLRLRRRDRRQRAAAPARVPERARATGLELSDEAYYARYLGYDDVGVFRRWRAIAGSAGTTRTDQALFAEKGERFEELAARGEMLFPGAADFIRAARARRADRHRVGRADATRSRTCCDRAGLREPLPRHRRRRSDARSEAVAGSVSRGVRAACGGRRPRRRSAPHGRHRGFAVGPRVGARRRPADRRRRPTPTRPTRSPRMRSSSSPACDALTLDALDGSVERRDRCVRGWPHDAGRGASVSSWRTRARPARSRRRRRC